MLLDRRAFLCGSLVTTLVTTRAWPQTAPVSAGPADPKLIEDLVAANRVLADQGVMDGDGHVSVRHPADPQRYLMSRSIAPEMVTAGDVMEYDLDSNPVDARGRASYLERFIHGEIYRARPDVTAVVHNHSPSVIPFGVSTAPLRPLYSLPRVVFRSVYTEMNARLQAQAMALGGPVTYLDDEEARRAEAAVGGTISRPWEPWKKNALAR